MTDVVPGPGSEMGTHPRIVARVQRLALVSSVALGAVFVLAVTGLETHAAINISLAAGWLLMPVLLALSVRRPRLRYLLVVPSLLMGTALVFVCVTALPVDSAARAGWLLVTGGVLLGGALGVWFWYRWIPVPRFLDEPFCPGRWVLIGIHVALILIGLALVVVAEYIR